MSALFLHQLEAMFGWILAASWQASVLALLVLLAQKLLGARLNPRWRYALWLLVLVRLVLPALPESAWSLFQFAPPPPTSFVEPVTEPLFAATPLPVSQVEMPAIEPGYPFSFFSVLAIVWLTGASALLLLTLQVNRRFSRQIADSPEIVDPELLQLFASAQAELHVSRSIRLIESSQVQSPAIMGLFRSTLLLPTDVRSKFDSRELRFIFLHELAHLKRGDVFAQAIIAALQIIHWFNPVLWFAFRRMRIDREPATDALVLSRTGEMEKEHYGLMLIKLLEHFNQRHSLPTLVGILEDKDQLKRRFSLIAKFTRGAYGWSLLGILLIGILAIACLTKTKNADNARVEFQVNGQTVQLSEKTQQDTTTLLEKLLKVASNNGAPSEIIQWQRLPTASVEDIKKSGSFLHLTYAKEQPLQRGDYTNLVKDVWIGLEDTSLGDSYPGHPGGITVTGTGKPNPWNLSFGSKSLLVGIGLNAEILPHLSASMQKTLTDSRQAYQDYQKWASSKTADTFMQAAAAVNAGDVAALQKLIAQGVDLKAIVSDDETLLFHARSPEMVELLVKQGIDVNAHNKQNSTALDEVCLNGGKNAAPTARALLEHGADPNNIEDGWGAPPFYSAMDGATVDALAEYGANLKLRGADDMGPFDMAYGDPSYYDALLRHGVPFDPKTDGTASLVHASFRKNFKLVKWLLDHGVDPNAKGLVSNEKSGPKYAYPLVEASIANDEEIAAVLLDHGARGELAMEYALRNHNNKMVKLLWQHGVRNISELCYTISQGAPLSDLENLLKQGIPADPPQDTVVTPLGEAAEMGNLPAVQMLVQHGADVKKGGIMVPDHPEYVFTPLILAADRGQDDIVDFLLKHGAKPDPRAVEMAANTGVPSGFFDYLPSKEHFERTVQLLIDAGALKNLMPEVSGKILVSSIATCRGEPDPLVVKALLAAGLNPQDPAKARDGTFKPVIEVIREYSKQKYTSGTERYAPYIDLLDKAQKSTSPSETQLMVRLVTKVFQISDADYQAHQSEIDAAVQKGDVAALAGLNLKSLNRFADPFTVVKAGEQGVVEVVRLVHYPVAFGKDFNGQLAGVDFKRGVVGTRFVSRPTATDTTISVKGYLYVTSLAGWTPTHDITSQPEFQERVLQISEPFQSGQTKGFQLPGGAQMESRDPTLVFTADKIPTDSENPKTLARDFLFLSANLYTWDGKPVTSATPTTETSGNDAKVSADLLTARTFLVPPGFFPGSPADFKQELVKRGINFPDGATVELLADKQKLVVRNTPEELDKISAQVNAKGTVAGQINWPPTPAIPTNLAVPATANNTAATKADAASTTAPNVAAPTASANSPQIQLHVSVAQIPEDVYQANRDKVDAAVKSGDSQILNLLKGVSAISLPSVSTPIDTKASMDITRVMAYPTSYEKAKATIPPTPKEFGTTDVGVAAEITPSLNEGKIVLYGTFKLTNFEGMTTSSLGPATPTFDTRETHFLEALNDHQNKGIWIPGYVDNGYPVKTNAIAQKAPAKNDAVPMRMILFVSASQVKQEKSKN